MNLKESSRKQRNLNEKRRKPEAIWWSSGPEIQSCDALRVE